MFRTQRASSSSRINASSGQGVRNRSSSLSRLSQQNTASFSRRSSFVDQDKRMKDTRPLSEKSYQTKCIFKLVAFLNQNSYPHPLSQKMLMSPFSKDIFRIFEFIYRTFNPGYGISKKPEEEILKILKNMRYPFSMNKSTLQNAGSSRAWAAVLGMLMWLMEVSQYSNAANEEFSRNSSCLGVVAMQHERLGKSFALMLEADGFYNDDDEDEQCFGKIYGLDEARETLSRAQDQCEFLEKQLMELEDEEVKLRQVENQNKIMSADAKTLQDYITNMEECTDKKRKEIADLESNLQKQIIFLKSEEEEVDRLRTLCQEQNQKGENMYQVQCKRQEMVEKLNREEEQLAQLKQQQLTSEQELSHYKRKLDIVSRTFNNAVSELRTLAPHEMCLLDSFDAHFPGCSKEDTERIKNHLLSLSKKLKKDIVSTENTLIKQEEYNKELKLQLSMSSQDLNDKLVETEEKKRHSEDLLTKIKAESDQVESTDEALTQSINKLVAVLAITPEQRHGHINQLQEQLEDLTEEKNKLEDETVRTLEDEGHKALDAVAALEREEKEFQDFMNDYLSKLKN